MRLCLITFVICATTSITVPSTQKQCLIGDSYSTTSYPVDPFSSLVLSFSSPLTLKWRCHEGDEFFKALILSHAHARALSAQSQSPAFHAVAFHSLTLWESKRDPILPPHPRKPNICLFWPKELACWGGDAQYSLAQHTWPLLLSSSSIFRVSYQVILCLINNLTF